MKAFIYSLGFAGLLATVLFTNSCQKVIDVDLNDASANIVVEGEVLVGDTTHRVKITRTMNFDESGEFPTVQNAIVTVVDNLGNSGTFTHVGDGVYELSSYPGVEGRTYTLTVVVDGKTYSASSTMPAFVPMDSLYAEQIPFGADTFSFVTPERLDPAGIANYYQFRITQNGEVYDGITLQTDQLYDGNTIVEPLFLEELEVNDTIRVDMFSITKAAWTYHNQLLNNSTGQSTPANPISNFSGGCLGFFSTRGCSSKTLIFQ